MGDSNGQGSNGSNGNGRSNGNGNGHGHVVFAPTGQTSLVGNPPRGDDELDLAAIVSVIRDRKLTIALIAFAVFAAVMAVTAFSRMDFTVSASLYMGDLKAQSSSNLLDAVSSQFDLGMEKGEINTEIELLKSRKLMTQAILVSGLNVQLIPAGWAPPRYWQWRLGHRDPRALDGAWNEIRATSTQLTGTVHYGEKRDVDVVVTSASTYDVMTDGQRLGTGTFGKPLEVPGLSITLVAVEGTTPKQGATYELEVHSIDDVLEKLNKDIDKAITSPKAATVGAETDIIEFVFTSRSPNEMRAFVSALLDAYLDQNLAWKTEEASNAETFLTKQLETVRKSLDKAASDLAEFKKQSNTIDVTETAKAMLGEMAAVEQERVTARLVVDGLEQIRTQLARGNVSTEAFLVGALPGQPASGSGGSGAAPVGGHAGAPTEAFLVGEASDTVLMAMGQQLVASDQAVKALSEQFTPDYPPLKEARAALAAQLKSVQAYVNTRLARAREQLASLEAVQNQYTNQLKKLPDAEQKLVVLTQETEVYGKLYEFLLEKQQEAGETKASTISKTKVLDRADFQSLEETPRLSVRFVFGAVVGLLLGIGFVLARWRFASSFQSEKELRGAFPAVPLFATVPRLRASKRAKLASSSPIEVLGADLRSPLAESFRLLRTNIYYSGDRDRDKVIVVSSPGPGDGKTTTTLCLATVLAADGKRVLVVDGDMRKPSHHVLLRQPQHPGLTGILTNEIRWTAAVHSVDLPTGKFSSISTGIVPPNPAELLSSPRIAAFLAEAREQYDFILIDSPPFPLVSDALVLSRYADRLLTVVRTGVTGRRAAEEHIHRLGTSPHYGLVINDVSDRSGYGYGYGYAGYGYGYGADVQNPKSSKSAKSSSKGSSKDAPSPPKD